MQGTIRLLSGAVKPGSRLKKPAMNLEQFIIHQRVISLWREILRSTKREQARTFTNRSISWLMSKFYMASPGIPSSSTKGELRSFARGEFERHRNVTDVGHIRYLLSTGKTEFDTMRRYIDEQIS
ncbi:uncharacterized protein MCYG_05728 [Microsporum canis CBS 113480]|uniref:LYR motif-containing protein 2 n=1 Tax=Arthroderma otae (strain ATCC MYA-4605 / CBS 113480) TaxID=554155 RepID=C5FSQ6_ARTOC|nr:uncharacterized protein MCYG_05728 [Microsporum canis CBS 113480]EEQ32909.1 predicted protein [Microsporum canis CBS 113480]